MELYVTLFHRSALTAASSLNFSYFRRQTTLLSSVGDRRVYFEHSYRGTPTTDNADWVLATSGRSRGL